jgi:RES domain-containing protein
VISAWRITKTRYAAAAFDGEGARLHGGRWNSRGTRVSYASESVALAVLEVLVGLQDTALLSAYSLIQIEFPERLVEVVSLDALPSTWTQHPPSPDTQRIGDLWVVENRSAVLQVPSAIVDAEHNYLLNPGHGDFAQVVINRPERFRLDPRLVKGAERRAKP